jgi:hypothetical protein
MFLLVGGISGSLPIFTSEVFLIESVCLCQLLVKDDAVDNTTPDVVELYTRLTSAITWPTKERVPMHFLGVIDVRILKRQWVSHRCLSLSSASARS